MWRKPIDELAPSRWLSASSTLFGEAKTSSLTVLSLPCLFLTCWCEWLQWLDNFSVRLPILCRSTILKTELTLSISDWYQQSLAIFHNNRTSLQSIKMLQLNKTTYWWMTQIHYHVDFCGCNLLIGWKFKWTFEISLEDDCYRSRLERTSKPMVTLSIADLLVSLLNLTSLSSTLQGLIRLVLYETLL